MAVLSVDLLWHTSEIIHKADRQRPRPNWTNLPLKKTNSPTSTMTILALITTQVMKPGYTH